MYNAESYVPSENGGRLDINGKKVHVIGLSMEAHKWITAIDYCMRWLDVENRAKFMDSTTHAFWV